MNDVSLITPDQEKTLSKALVSAIQNVNDGGTPHEALAKSANDHGLTPQFACRMTEAYNASKTVKYLQSTEGEKRAHDFDLANHEEVLRLMYKDNPPAKEVTAATKFIPGKVYTAAKAAPEMTKAAGEDTPGKRDGTGPAKGSYMDRVFGKGRREADGEECPSKKKKREKKAAPALRNNQVTKLASLVTELDRAGAELRMERAHAGDQILKSACSLKDSLRIPGHESFEELERRVTSTYGEMGKKAMDIIWGMSDFERLGEKRASAPDRLLLMGTGPTYDSAREMMKWLEKAARIDKQVQEWQKSKAQVTELLSEQSGQQPGGTGATFVSDPGMPRRPATAPLVDVDKAVGGGARAYESKEAADKGVSVSDPTGFLAAPSKPAAPVSIFDPAHEGKLRAIRTRIVVNDMISNDPILSAHPPEAVFNAYNELSRIAPGITNEPIVIRSLIGRSLQTGGRMEQNEIKQLLDAEKAHREIRVKGF